MADQLQDPDEILEAAREMLDEGSAILIPKTESLNIPLLGDNELVRGWDELQLEDIPQCVAYLEDYTSAKNTRKLNYVDDPQAGGETYTGRYRHAFVRQIVQGEVETVIQVLRKGYIETLVSGANVIWDEARMRQSRKVTGNIYDDTPLDASDVKPENYLEVSWTGVSPDKVNAIVGELDALAADTFAPTIRKESYGTAWHRLFVASKIETDGSATVTLFLARPEFRLYGFRNYATERQSGIQYIWNVPKSLAQGIITAAKTARKSASVSYSPQRGLCDIIISDDNRDYIFHSVITGQNCDTTSTTYYHWSVFDKATIAIPASTAGTTVTSNIRPNGDGTYDITYTVSVRSFRETDWTDSLVAAHVTRDVYEQRGIYDDSQIEAMTTPAPQGVTQRRAIRIQADCSKDVTLSRDTSIEDQVKYQAFDTVKHTKATTLYKNQRSKLNAEASGGGYLYNLEQNENPDGTFDARQDITEAKDHAFSWFSDSRKAAVMYEALYSGRTAPLEPSAHPLDAGWITRTSNRIEGDGSFTSAQTDIYSQPMETGTTWLSDEGTGVSLAFRNQTTFPALTGWDVYDIAPPSFTQNDDGTFSGSVTGRPPGIKNNAKVLLLFEEKTEFSWEEASTSREAGQVLLVVTVAFTNSGDDAENFMDETGLSGQGDVNMPVSGIVYLGNSRFKATRRRVKIPVI